MWVIYGTIGSLVGVWLIYKLASLLLLKLQGNGLRKIIATGLLTLLLSCILRFSIGPFLPVSKFVLYDSLAILYLVMISIVRWNGGNLFTKLIDHISFRIVSGIIIFPFLIGFVKNMLPVFGVYDPFYMWGLLVSVPYTLLYIMSRPKERKHVDLGAEIQGER